MMKAMVYQMPLIQLAIIVLVVLLTEAEVIVKGNVSLTVFITDYEWNIISSLYI